MRANSVTTATAPFRSRFLAFAPLLLNKPSDVELNRFERSDDGGGEDQNRRLCDGKEGEMWLPGGSLFLYASSFFAFWLFSALVTDIYGEFEIGRMCVVLWLCFLVLSFGLDFAGFFGAYGTDFWQVASIWWIRGRWMNEWINMFVAFFFFFSCRGCGFWLFLEEFIFLWTVSVKKVRWFIFIWNASC